VRYLLTFHAVEDEWLALPEAERNAAIADIGRWFAEHSQGGKIVEGHRLGRGTRRCGSAGCARRTCRWSATAVRRGEGDGRELRPGRGRR